MLVINRSLIGTIKYVYSDDPALDKKDPGYNPDAFESSGDMAHLPVKLGEKLTIFHLKSLSMKRVQRITSMKRLDGDFTAEQFGECVAFGLKDVENMEVNGKKFELQLEEVNGEERVKDKSLEQIHSIILFRELGMRILAVSNLSF